MVPIAAVTRISVESAVHNSIAGVPATRSPAAVPKGMSSGKASAPV